MDCFNVKAAGEIETCSAAFEDIFFMGEDKTTTHFDRMVEGSKFIAAASKTETKKVLEWIKHSTDNNNIKLMTGGFYYFTVPDAVACTFKGVEVKQNSHGPQIFAPWTKENAASFYKLLGSVLALYNCCKDNKNIAKGLGLRSGFTVFGDNFSFVDADVVKVNGFLINLFLVDKDKKLNIGKNQTVTCSFNNLGITKNGRDLKATYKLIA